MGKRFVLKTEQRFLLRVTSILLVATLLRTYTLEADRHFMSRFTMV